MKWSQVDWILAGSVVWIGARYLESFFEMQFASAAVVIEAIGDVGVLLDFAQSNAGADRVNGPGFGEVCLAGL